MNTLRTVIAVMLVVAIPAAIAYWLLIHPLVCFWRRLGTKRAYAFICSILAVIMVGMFLCRDWLLSNNFGTNWSLVALGIICLSFSGWMRFRLKDQLPIRVLIGLPELKDDRAPGDFITGGLYARMRHPRYVQMTLALLGYALIANYPAVYVMFMFWCAGITVIAFLEERELAERFGAKYREYRCRVPRFVPRLRR